MSVRRVESLATKKAAKHGVTIDDLITPDGQSYLWTDFTSFLAAYDRVAALFVTDEDQFDVWMEHGEKKGALRSTKEEQANQI